MPLYGFSICCCNFNCVPSTTVLSSLSLQRQQHLKAAVTMCTYRAPCAAGAPSSQCLPGTLTDWDKDTGWVQLSQVYRERGRKRRRWREAGGGGNKDIITSWRDDSWEEWERKEKLGGNTAQREKQWEDGWMMTQKDKKKEKERGRGGKGITIKRKKAEECVGEEMEESGWGWKEVERGVKMGEGEGEERN